MASGCTSSSSPSLNGCTNPTTDKCIKYTGDPIPSLGICTGDFLNELESIILTQLVNFATGQGIMVSGIDFTTCNLFASSITCCNASGDVPKSLKDLLKIIYDSLCNLDGRTATLETFINDLKTGPYTTGCLAGLPASPTFKQIIQAILVELCALDTRVGTLETEFTTLSTGIPATIGDFLLAHITSCQGPDVVKKTGTGATASIQLLGMSPIGAIIAYDGDLSLFDSNGLGRTGTSACGWHLCNGLGGTPNMNGVGIMGTTTMGGSTNPAAAGGTYSHGVTGGEVNHLLSAYEIPTVPISVNIIEGAGHDHPIYFNQEPCASGDSSQKLNPIGIPNANTISHNPDVSPSGSGSTVVTTYIGKNKTGITATAAMTGGGGSHNNLSPYIALEWIKRVS